jgi:hypothetical protein
VGVAPVACAAACLFLLCALSPSATAAVEGNSLFGETGLQDEFTLGRAPHTVLNMSTSGQRVTLTVSRGAQSVSYEVPGTVSEDRVKANFGRAGKIDLRFKPSGPPRSIEPPLFCKGKDLSMSAGAFVGTIGFTGFDRFVHFHASRVKGQVSRTPPLHCHIPGGPRKHPPVEESGEPESKTIALSAFRPCGGPVFVALADTELVSPIVGFAAISREHVGRVQVSRFVLMFPRRRPSLFSFDPGLGTATVAPPAPFHGTAAFQRGTDGAPSSWSGPLSIAFLDGRQALTGDGFEAELEAVSAGADVGFGGFECEPGHAQTSALAIP